MELVILMMKEERAKQGSMRHPGDEQQQGGLESHKYNSAGVFRQPLLKLTSLGPGQATMSKADSPVPT